MAKVTSKLQVTIPKRIAEEYGIAPGDEIAFVPAGDIIRLIPAGGRRSVPRLSLEERLRLFDESTARQREREKRMVIPSEPPAERDWQREDLYVRGKPR
jgi:AbrB family looped-hinge helix DNA binding protein